MTPAIEPLARSARLSTFAPLRHRNFRLLWTGLVVSNAGGWMQFTALGYLMDLLTLSPIFLGLLGLAQAVPRLLFAFLGGVVADRADRRAILLLTNLVSMASALLLALLTYLGVVQVWHVLAIAAFNSLVHSFDMPARLSMLPGLVAEHEVLQAISLNAMALNGSSIFGPAIAGVVISLIGTSAAFFLNALSYLGVLAALRAMRLPGVTVERRVSFGQDVREGLAILARHRVVLALLGIVAAVSFFGRPYVRLMPALAREVLHVGPEGLGILQAAPGAGTIVAVFLTGWSAGRVRPGSLLLSAALAMGIMVTLFGASRAFPYSVLLLVLVGVSQSIAMATANTLVQTTVPPATRGRAMGLFGTVAFGMTTLGTLPIGALAEVIGLSWAVALGGVVVIAVILAAGIALPALRRL
ncbi:MAG: MFS transporter [bacterium]